MATELNVKCEILADLWLNYRDDEEFSDFCEYNDLGLPLAYAVSADIITISKQATAFIEETFDLLVAALDIEDTGFESLDEMLEKSEEEKDGNTDE